MGTSELRFIVKVFLVSLSLESVAACSGLIDRQANGWRRSKE